MRDISVREGLTWLVATVSVTVNWVAEYLEHINALLDLYINSVAAISVTFAAILGWIRLQDRWKGNKEEK